MHSILTHLNLGQDVANKLKYAAAHIVAKSHPLHQAVGMSRHSSLININPSATSYSEHIICNFVCCEFLLTGVRVRCMNELKKLSFVKYPIVPEKRQSLVATRVL